ncbi:MAG: DUF3237 domain-containing protein [Acidimicrobiia bacterium]|nr:DUF3237 domain-containing protein [Acidimicrobiia bacterium]
MSDTAPHIPPLELVPLARASVELATPFVLPDTPAGTLMIFEVTDAVFEGERLRGRMVGRAAADWLRVSSGGVGTLDVRCTIETHDGALVYVAYSGRINTLAEQVFVYGTPQFNTGDERYAWLNAIQCVYKGVGSADTTHLDYDCYELR